MDRPEDTQAAADSEEQEDAQLVQSLINEGNQQNSAPAEPGAPGQAEVEEGGSSASADTATPTDSSQPEVGSPSGESPQLTGEALLRLLSENQEAQQIMQGQFARWLGDAQSQAVQQQAAQEFTQLVQDGRFDEIGRRFVQERQEEALRGSVRDEVLREVYGQMYGFLFSQPEMQQLTAEDKEHLAPHKYSTDAEYVMALQTFITGKRQGASLDEVVGTRVNATLEALKNLQAADRNGSRSIAGLPGAVANPSVPKSSSQLIREGLSAMIAEAQEESTSED